MCVRIKRDSKPAVLRTSPVHAAMAELMKVAYIGNGFALPDGGGDMTLNAAVLVRD